MIGVLGRRLWVLVPRRLRRLVRVALAGCLLRVIDLALRLTSYRRVTRWLLALSPTPDPAHINQRRARRAARLINSTARLRPFRVTCLRRSLALWWLLRWYSLPSHLRFGVNPTDGHTWVEHHQHVINDRYDIASRYAVLYQDELSPEKMAALVRVVDSS